MKGYDEKTGLYTSRYYAKKYNPSAEVIVHVDGGYKVMSFVNYFIFRKQK